MRMRGLKLRMGWAVEGAEDLYVGASEVVGTYDRVSKFEVALRHASGPWRGEEWCSREHGQAFKQHLGI